jgi:hypothetical protein
MREQIEHVAGAEGQQRRAEGAADQRQPADHAQHQREGAQGTLTRIHEILEVAARDWQGAECSFTRIGEFVHRSTPRLAAGGAARPT